MEKLLMLLTFFMRRNFNVHKICTEKREIDYNEITFRFSLEKNISKYVN